MVPGSISAAEDISEQRFMEMMAAQQNALNANLLLMESIGTDYSQYPDCYGGVYIKDDILHILVADSSGKTVAWIDGVLREYSDWITIDEVEYSYNYLYNLAETSAEAMCSITKPYDITGYYVDIVNNVGVITVANGDIAAILERNYVSREGPSATLRFEVVESLTRSSNDESIFSTDLNSGSRGTITLKGGMQINNSSKWFTIGFCGTFSKLDAFVTCGHGQDANEWTRTGNSIGSGSILGAVSYIRYQNNGNGDFSIHTIASGLPDTVVLTNKVQNVSDSGTDISVTGTYSNPPVGTYYFKYNATPVTSSATKFRSYCEVINVGVTILSDNTLYLKNMTVGQFVSSVGTSVGGDSGGSCFLLDGSTWKIAGVHSGSITSGTGDVYFTPWTYISGAGFTAKTS